VLFLMLACAPADETVLEPGCDLCALTDANQYRLSAELTAAEALLAPGKDVVIDFAGLTQDLQGHPVDPAVDIDQVSLLAFRNLEPAEIRERLVNDELQQSDVAGWLTAYPTGTTVQLSGFGTSGNTVDAPDYFVGGTTWMVILARDEGSTAASVAFLLPSESAVEEKVIVDNSTSRLAVDVDLAAFEPVIVEPGRTDVVLDWSAVETDGFGHEFVRSTATELALYRFDETPEALSAAALDLDALVDESWTLQLNGRPEATLDDLRGETPFTGISTGSTWVMMLRAADSLNPAPYLLTRLKAAR